MANNEPAEPEPGQRRCPVCWSWFTANSPNNPYPRRYCCGACRIEDSRRRRRREHDHAQLLDERENPTDPD